ncbi:MAG: DUF1987 domain-containing protein [Fluviicola sp.]|nr:DUF1987 domain-containing protein [Fluviicola sp.]
MEVLKRESTPETPMINFNSENGLMELKGRSIPFDSDEFWLPILSWFESYMLSPKESTTFKIKLEYFNISSSKRILFLLYKLNELSEKGLSVKVIWEYRKEDVDMYEVGQDYAYMVKVPFDFIEFEDKELAPL